jgi:hypothetical protein
MPSRAKERVWYFACSSEDEKKRWMVELEIMLRKQVSTAIGEIPDTVQQLKADDIVVSDQGLKKLKKQKER